MSGLRSERWFGGRDISGFIHRASVHAEGISRNALAGRPVVRNLMAMDVEECVAGIHCADSLGRIDVDAVGVEITCGGVVVADGDLVLADFDGVVIVPAAVAYEVIRLSEEKVAGENLVRRKLEEGMPVTDAFRTYGVI